MRGPAATFKAPTRMKGPPPNKGRPQKRGPPQTFGGPNRVALEAQNAALQMQPNEETSVLMRDPLKLPSLLPRASWGPPEGPS